MSHESAECRSADPAVLIAGTDAGLRHRACRLVQTEFNWPSTEAASAADVFQTLATTEPLILISELSPTGWPGLDFLDDLRDRHPDVSVVVLMTDGSETLTLKALQGGVAGYASAAHLEQELPEPLERVASSARAGRDRKRLRACLTDVELEFRLENDPQMIPALVAEVQEHLSLFGVLDHSAHVRLGVALEEALINGMVHGNLEISSAVKQLGDAAYRAVIDERRTKRPYRVRRLRFRVRISRDRAKFRVQDQGPGFDPTSLPDPTDPANLEMVSGRGLLLIHTFMDDVRFNRRGNVITMFKRFSPERSA